MRLPSLHNIAFCSLSTLPAFLRWASKKSFITQASGTEFNIFTRQWWKCKRICAVMHKKAHHELQRGRKCASWNFLYPAAHASSAWWLSIYHAPVKCGAARRCWAHNCVQQWCIWYLISFAALHYLRSVRIVMHQLHDESYFSAPACP